MKKITEGQVTFYYLFCLICRYVYSVTRHKEKTIFVESLLT